MAVDSDILSQVLENQKSQEQVFRDIDISLSRLADSMSLAEIENTRLSRNERRALSDRDTRDREDEDRWKVNRDRSKSKGFQGIMEDYEKEFAKQLWSSLTGDTVDDILKAPLKQFAQDLGTTTDELGKKLGSIAGDKIGSLLKNSPLADAFSPIEDFKKRLGDSANKSLTSLSKYITGQGEGTLASAQSLTEVIGGVRGAMAPMTDTLAGFGSAVSSSAGSLISFLGPQGILIGALAIGLLAAIDKWTEEIQESWDEVKKAGSALGDAMDDAKHRTRELLKLRVDEQVKRLDADFKSMVTANYDIMREASQQMLSAWDDSLRTITATQGYTKAGMQDLLSGFAERLRNEGLSSVVSTADITTNLSKVLESGLSGQVAEEFAYLATVLNAAIPTEDFFSYAETYASVAANAIAAGKSQQEAIDYANAELEQFASNLLYSSRELAGGFSSGLKNASSLFESANKIAVASRTGEASEISGVLTAVSAAIGAVAPDLASGLVDNVIQAALGGNTETVTALRSLSGVGASNTAFLKALATDAQGVFETLFNNLANLQSMSKDNYMEVAEGLSSIFGVSMDAFARVDFSYLADVIGAMSIDGDSLGQNLAQLVSGQTTYTAEQARIAEVNKVMIEEGLAYVLDNEVARSIQEHMWDEQLAQEIKETEFAVNLQGNALKFLQTIANLVENILDFLNPLSFIKDAANLLETAADSKYRQQEIEAMLKATVVGSGNSLSYYNLTTRGKDLNLTQSYLERLGIDNPVTFAGVYRDAMHGVSRAAAIAQTLTRGSINIYSSEMRDMISSIGPAYQQATASVIKNAVESSYTWATVGKSALSRSGYRGAGNSGSYYEALTAQSSAQNTMIAASQEKLNQLINSMESFVKDNKSFTDWQKSATKFGIVDLEQALSDFGLTMEDAKGQFTNLETAAGIQKKHEMQELENKFYEASILWFETTWPADLQDTQDLLLDMHDELMDQLIKSHRQLEDFYDEWIDYYVNHTAYSQETLDAYSVAKIRTAERSEVGDSVLALAEALTTNTIDLKDPAVQTNVLLAKILMITEAIMQQTNDTTTVSLPTALSALGLNMTTETAPRV